MTTRNPLWGKTSSTERPPDCSSTKRSCSIHDDRTTEPSRTDVREIDTKQKYNGRTYRLFLGGQLTTTRLIRDGLVTTLEFISELFIARTGCGDSDNFVPREKLYFSSSLRSHIYREQRISNEFRVCTVSTHVTSCIDKYKRAHSTLFRPIYFVDFNLFLSDFYYLCTVVR